MDKDKKARSGTLSDAGKKNQGGGGRGKTEQPGAPMKSNRQTGGNDRRERDDSHGAEKNTTKKGSNNI